MYLPRRLRVRLERYLASYTRWRHPPCPRRWREPPRLIRCVQTARPSVTILSQPFCLVSPPGCLRACLGSLFGCQLDDQRLPFTWRGKPRVFGGYCGMISSIAGEQPKLGRSAGGNPSNRSLRSKGRHSDGNATAPPDSAAIATSLQRIRVCAAVQVAPILRIPPRNSRNLMEPSFTTRTRRAPAASGSRSSHTGMSLPFAQNHPSKRYAPD
jgi:hypothetical protein